MWYFILKKLLNLFSILVGTILLQTVLISLVPGQDGTFLNRLFEYSKMIITLNFGYANGWNSLPVSDLVISRLGKTALLTAGAVVINILIALPFGIFFALRPNSYRTKLFSAILNITSSIPVLVIGYFIIFVSAEVFKFIPTYDQFEYATNLQRIAILILPMTVLAFGDGLTSDLIRHIREEVSHVTKEPFMLAVKARNVSFLKHLAKNTILPVYSLFVSKIAYLLGGAVIVEHIFNWKGFGYQTWNAVWTRDYNVIVAVSVVFVIIILTTSFSKEFLTAIIHPKTQ